MCAAMADDEPVAATRSTLRQWLRHNPLTRLGPGLITGVADDDPSGIATYSQAGAQFGLNMLWTMPVAYPLMAAVQSMCARLGRVTGRGLSANIKAQFPPVVLRVVVTLLLIANTLNIAADVAAMGEAVELATTLDRHVATFLLVVITLLLQVLVPYHRYVGVLKWLTLSLLAYALVLLAIDVPWGEVLRRTVSPRFTLGAGAATMIVAVFGTTISPYLFFWQASEEVEDLRGAPGLAADPANARPELRRIAWDTWSGMFYSNITSYFIILATGLTLGAAGVTEIDTAGQAAIALKPLAGDSAALLFTVGIIGVGLIGVPVLAGSGAYALAETMGWNEGLERKAADARGFYGVIAASLLAALVIQYSPISAMRALFWSAVINGLVAVPLLVVVILLVSNRAVMGDFTARAPIRWLGWLTVAVMAVAAGAMAVPLL